MLSLLRPTDREMATAESVRADAILEIYGLRDEIDSLVGGPDAKELEHLQVHAGSDQVLLENALRGESLAEDEWDARIAPVKREVEEGEEEYRALFLHWLGVEAQDVNVSLPPDALLRQSETAETSLPESGLSLTWGQAADNVAEGIDAYEDMSAPKELKAFHDATTALLKAVHDFIRMQNASEPYDNALVRNDEINARAEALFNVAETLDGETSSQLFDVGCVFS